jgi:NADH dehydrogenase FAD-containing subunit
VAVDVTLIDRHNYHLFQPLLYQVATVALAPNAIAARIRVILRAQQNANVLTGICAAKRVVPVGAGHIFYDFL